ncbi:MAG: hypothetical protein GY935_11295 [Gammaproteobacteria bacterium]|nr:hypothetical protein [Gammaproteobacteria bacterium]
MGKYKQFIETLHTGTARLDGQTDSIEQLQNWVETTSAGLSTDDDTIDQPFIYVCAGETLQLEVRQVVDRQAIPDQQVLYEAI